MKYKKKAQTKEEIEIENMKFEITKELGLYEKVKDGGWGNLTSKETGKIGGILSRRKKKRTD